MKIKVSESSGSVLDWMVAKCVVADGYGGKRVRLAKYGPLFGKGYWWPTVGSTRAMFSTKWQQGGPIIEREKLCVGHKHQADPEYCPINDPATNCWARTTAGGYLSCGPTPLIAAMRCFVVSKLGEIVEVPDELI
jgi:hypothetical protein